MGSSRLVVALAGLLLSSGGARADLRAAGHVKVATPRRSHGHRRPSVKQLRDELARARETGDAARELVATVRLGEALWRSSCPMPGILGLCVAGSLDATLLPEPRPDPLARFRYRHSSPSCVHYLDFEFPDLSERAVREWAPSPAPDVRVRAEKPAEEARALFAAALRLSVGGVLDSDAVKGAPGSAAATLRAEVLTAIAHAHLRQGDDELERLLALGPPRKVDFSTARLMQVSDDHIDDVAPPYAGASTPWLERQGELMAIARRPFVRAIRVGETPIRRLAVARVAQLHFLAANQVLAARIPPPPRAPRDFDRDEYLAWRAEAHRDGQARVAVGLQNLGLTRLRECVADRPADPLRDPLYLWCEDAARAWEGERGPDEILPAVHFDFRILHMEAAPLLREIE